MPDDPDGTFIAAILLSVLFAAIAALYAAGESALSVLSVSQLKRDADAGGRKARSLLKLVRAQESVVSPLQSGLLFCGLLGLSFCVTAFGSRAYEDAAGEMHRMLSCLLAALAYVLVFFLFCDILPKKGARHAGGQYAYRHARLISGLSKAAMPLLGFTNLTANCLLRLFRIDPHSLDDAVTEEEIMQMVGEGEERA